MSTADMKRFVQLLHEGASSHGRRIALLEQGIERIRDERERLARSQTALEQKIRHYEQLIIDGLDCDGAPVPEDMRVAQASGE